MKAGFILIHRQIMEWEWYQNLNTFRVFTHCLLMANYTDGRFEGKEVKRGQFVTSLPTLADETGLSIRQVRTALDHLILTGELTSKSYPKYRMITVVKYDDFQLVDRQNDRQATGKRQASDRVSGEILTGKRQAETIARVSEQDEQETNLTGNRQAERQQYNNNNELLKVVVEEGFTPTDAEIAKSIERDSKIVDAARDVGLQVSTRAMVNARDLADKYGLDKLLDAIGASVDVPKWSYVEGILRKGGAKDDGHTDNRGKSENPYAFLHNRENTV